MGPNSNSTKKQWAIRKLETDVPPRITPAERERQDLYLVATDSRIVDWSAAFMEE